MYVCEIYLWLISSYLITLKYFKADHFAHGFRYLENNMRPQSWPWHNCACALTVTNAALFVGWIASKPGNKSTKRVRRGCWAWPRSQGKARTSRNSQKKMMKVCHVFLYSSALTSDRSMLLVGLLNPAHFHSVSCLVVFHSPIVSRYVPWGIFSEWMILQASTLQHDTFNEHCLV